MLNQTSFLTNQAPTILVLVLFLILCLLAALGVAFIGKRIFNWQPLSFIRIFMYSALGGIIGLTLPIYLTVYLSAGQDKTLSSLFLTFGLLTLFTFINMLFIPLVVLGLSRQQRKIKNLEAQLRKKE